MLEAKNGRIFSFDPIILIQLKIQKGHRAPQKKNTNFEPKIKIEIDPLNIIHYIITIHCIITIH